MLDAAARNSKRIIIARAVFGADSEGRFRVLVLQPGPSSAETLHDEWLFESQIVGLESEYRARGLEILWGYCDAMFSTEWNFAWGSHEDSFLLVAHEGITLLVNQRTIYLSKGRGPSPKLKRIKGQVAAIHGHLGWGWMRRSVRIKRRWSTSCTIASLFDLTPLTDPTYDGLDLCDARWVSRLTFDLATYLSVPATTHPYLPA